MAKIEKRFSKGMTFIGSYTWSHNIDQGNESLDENLSGRANQYDLRNERGNSGLDRRHNFVGSFTYEFPFGRGRSFGADWHRGLDAVLGGWQVGGLLSLRTGTPFDVTYPGDTQNSGTTNRGTRTGLLDATRIGNTCGRLPPRVSLAIHLRIPWLLAFPPLLQFRGSRSWLLIPRR